MFSWKLELKERSGITQGVWDNFSALPITPQSLYGCCWDTLARAAGMGQKREIWSVDVSYEPGRGRTVGPSSRQRRALILERRQQCDASIKVPVCNSAIGTEPGNHKLSINGFTTDDSEVILLSLVFLSSCIVIFWFFAGFIYHWPFHFLQPFFACVDLAPLIDNNAWWVALGCLSGAHPIPLSVTLFSRTGWEK